jgi:uncharacterized BrkB/YihY/UPF0761 family membrane protein
VAALVTQYRPKAFGDYETMTAVALAFCSLLGIVPVLIAFATLYGLVANPAAVQSLVEELRGFVPTQAANVLADLKSSGQGFGLGIGFAVSLGIVLWTAQWAALGLLTALNIVFDAAEQRSFLQRQLLALVVASSSSFWPLSWCCCRRRKRSSRSRFRIRCCSRSAGRCWRCCSCSA